jgi:hypothetical protein
MVQGTVTTVLTELHGVSAIRLFFWQ